MVLVVDSLPNGLVCDAWPLSAQLFLGELFFEVVICAMVNVSAEISGLVALYEVH